MAATAETVALGDIRGVFAAALAPAGPDDPPVFADLVDMVTPPALVLLWDEPWLTPGLGPGRNVMGPCLLAARLSVLCVAARMPEPGPGIVVLEGLVAYVIGRLRADLSYSWPLVTVGQPLVYGAADGVPYLGARVVYQIPVSI